MAIDLSQSLNLSICRHEDYILLISTADRVDLVLSYFLMIADHCIYDISLIILREKDYISLVSTADREIGRAHV